MHPRDIEHIESLREGKPLKSTVSDAIWNTH